MRPSIPRAVPTPASEDRPEQEDRARLRPNRRFVLSATALVATLLPGLGWAQGTQILRSTGRSVERAVRRQVGKALRPRLTVSNGYADPPGAIAISRQSTHLAVVSGGGDVRFFDLRSGLQTGRLAPVGQIVQLALGPTGTPILARHADGTIAIADGPGGPFRTLDGNATEGEAVTAVAVHGEEAFLGLGSGGATVLSLPEAQTVRRYPAAGGAVTALAPWSPADQGPMAGHADGSVRQLEPSGSARAVAAGRDGGGITSLALIDSKRLALGMADGTLKVIDPRDGDERDSERAYRSAITTVLPLSKRILAAAGDGGVGLFKRSGRRTETIFEPGAGPIGGMALGGTGLEFRAAISGPQGAIHILAKDDEDPLVALHLTRSGWGAVDRRGRFDGDDTAFENLAWSAEGLRLPIGGFAAGYFEPGLLAKHLNSLTVFLAAAPEPVTEGIPAPPQVRIDPLETPSRAGGEAVFAITASGNLPEGDVAFRVYHNGKRLDPSAVRDVEDSGERIAARVVLPASPGENRVAATIPGPGGIEGPAAETLFNTGGGGPRGALRMTAVGINDYRGRPLRLNYAVADARGVTSLFTKRARGLFDDIDAELVLDGDARRDGVLKAFAELTRASQDDTVVLFLSGHARTVGDTWYFLPQELSDLADDREVREIGISEEALAAALVALPARRVLLIVDTCQAGSIIGRFEGFGQRRALQSLGESTGVAIIAATRADQLAPEYAALGHGLLSYTLLEGLQREGGQLKADTEPHDGRLTVGELRRFVEARAPEIAGELDARFAEILAGRGGYTASISVTPVGVLLGRDFEIMA
ncbi:MAG: caspase family protein [Pseudomonadota bacterium]